MYSSISITEDIVSCHQEETDAQGRSLKRAPASASQKTSSAVITKIFTRVAYKLKICQHLENISVVVLKKPVTIVQTETCTSLRIDKPSRIYDVVI
jgi:hypothetical protein